MASSPLTWPVWAYQPRRYAHTGLLPQARTGRRPCASPTVACSACPGVPGADTANGIVSQRARDSHTGPVLGMRSYLTGGLGRLRILTAQSTAHHVGLPDCAIGRSAAQHRSSHCAVGCAAVGGAARPVRLYRPLVTERE
jgi:hypothetical protein